MKVKDSTDKVTVSFRLKNTGRRKGDEVAQVYVRIPETGGIVPIKELKGFERIFLRKGESREVKFIITAADLKFYNSELQYLYEPGEFDVMVGPNSRDVQTKRFKAE